MARADELPTDDGPTNSPTYSGDSAAYTGAMNSADKSEARTSCFKMMTPDGEVVACVD